MARRIDIELTSARDDGTWTWRAAGAKQPKGTLDAAILYPDPRIGDVVRAEADFEVEGITILSVAPPRARQADTDQIEYLGPPRAAEPGVQLFSSGRPTREGGRRPPRRDGDRRDRPDRGDRGDRRDRSDRGARAERGERPGRGERPDRRERRGPRPERAAPTPAAPKPKPKKLNAGRVHRDAVLADLPPEQRPIAEQVLRAGIPAVRRAIEAENAKATAEGRPEIKADALVALAEDLLPRLREAEWRDRADAAIADVDEIALRDLRAVVTSAETAGHGDDASRELAAQLREALERRLAQQRQGWLDEVTRSLDDGRVVRALRISGRPPEPGTKFPTELSQRLTEAAGQALAPDTPPDRWATVLDAVASSPVRRTVKPVGLPAEPGDELLAAAKAAAGRVPAVAELLGIEPTRPPRPPARKRPAPPPIPPTKVVPPGAPAKPSIGDSIPAPAAPTVPGPPPPPPSAAPPAPDPDEQDQAISEASTDSTR